MQDVAVSWGTQFQLFRRSYREFLARSVMLYVVNALHIWLRFFAIEDNWLTLWSSIDFRIVKVLGC